MKMGKDYEEVDWDNWSYENSEAGDTVQKGDDSEETIVCKDSNSSVLYGGETVAAIKDLPVKGGTNIKRGDKFKNIKLTEEEGIIESGKMVLKSEFFKKI